MIEFTKDAERRRLEKRPLMWEYFKTTDYDEAIREALAKGWAKKIVQLKVVQEHDTKVYYIEPYEEGCGCPGLIPYTKDKE